MNLWDFMGFLIFMIVALLALNFLPLKQQYWLYASKVETLYTNVSGIEFTQKPSWLQMTLAYLQKQIKNISWLISKNK